MSESKLNNVQALVLDATPIITQPATQLQQFADEFFTTPGVYNELKDEQVRNQLIIWGDKLKVRHPKKESIEAVVKFAKLTGDSHVLSQNDLHIIALAYEIDIEKNGGVNKLRKFPGEVRPEDAERMEKEKQERAEKRAAYAALKAEQAQEEQEDDLPKVDDDGFQVVTNKRKGKKQQNKMQEEPKEEPKVVVEESPLEETKEEDLEAEYDDADDDGEWITPDNLVSVMHRDENGEEIDIQAESCQINCALASGDFAVQNVTLQMGLSLMNSHSGMQIKRVRNYMLRCHACFTLIPIPKDNTPKHFCPSCGGPTLRRIAVSVNSQTGEVTPHLKKNFQWRTRGNIYSMPSPISKKSIKKYGNKGFQHRDGDKTDGNFFTEDQKEYQQAIKSAKWQQRQNEKAYEDFVGGGSADNCISPFFTGADIKQVHVKVGRGRFANQSKKKK